MYRKLHIRRDDKADEVVPVEIDRVKGKNKGKIKGKQKGVGKDFKGKGKVNGIEGSLTASTALRRTIEMKLFTSSDHAWVHCMSQVTGLTCST